MIKWTVIIAVALMLWIAEYKQELNDIMSEMKLPKGEKEEILTKEEGIIVFFRS